MNEDELGEWVTYHLAVFPSWKRCFESLRPEVKKVAKERMIQRFEGVSLADAKAATDRLEQMVNRPKLDQHVYEAATIARRIAFDRADVRGTGCCFCQGRGRVFAFAGSVVGYFTLWNRHDGTPPEVVSVRDKYAGGLWSEHGLRSIVALECLCEACQRPTRVPRATYERFVLEHGRVWRNGRDAERWGPRRFENLSPAEQLIVTEGPK